MTKFKKFLESIRELDPVLVEGIDRAHQLIMYEGMSEAGTACMKKMKKLVDQHGYWSEPVKEYSAEMEQDENLSADDRAMVHSTHMNMY